jgi:hypothetical protein
MRRDALRKNVVEVGQVAKTAPDDHDIRIEHVDQRTEAPRQPSGMTVECSGGCGVSGRGPLRDFGCIERIASYPLVVG